MHDPPLKHAVRRNDLEAVRMLVRGGADPNPTLHQLLWPSCDTSVVRMLLQAGASPSGMLWLVLCLVFLFEYRNNALDSLVERL